MAAKPPAATLPNLALDRGLRRGAALLSVMLRRQKCAQDQPRRPQDHRSRPGDHRDRKGGQLGRQIQLEPRLRIDVEEHEDLREGADHQLAAVFERAHDVGAEQHQAEHDQNDTEETQYEHGPSLGPECTSDYDDSRYRESIQTMPPIPARIAQAGQPSTIVDIPPTPLSHTAGSAP